MTVLYRNLSRPRLLAEDVRLRVKDANGDVYEPAPGVGNGGSDLLPGTPISTGTLVKGRLAFEVPREAQDLALIIDLAPETRARVDFR